MSIRDDVLKLIKSESSIELNEKKMDTNFKEFGVDSLDLMELILKIESKFGITLPDDKLLEVKTVNDLIKLIEQTKKIIS